MELEYNGVDIPVSALNLFDTTAILALVPVFDGFIYPWFKKHGRPLSMLQKIGTGESEEMVHSKYNAYSLCIYVPCMIACRVLSESTTTTTTTTTVLYLYTTYLDMGKHYVKASA